MVQPRGDEPGEHRQREPRPEAQRPLPRCDRFAAQDRAYRVSVLPPAVRARVAVEAASPLGWHRWVGEDGDVVAMEGFGASAPAKALYEHFGFTGQAIAARARAVLARTRG